MSRTLISVDLDWFNGKSNPLDKLRELLQHIPKITPAIMTVEHHEFLPQLRQWIKSGKVKTPFNIVNIDEHHDYYSNPPPYDPHGTETHCGNWGFRLPLEWYDRYTWVNNSEGDDTDWPEAKIWLGDRGIKCSVREQHRLNSLKSKIVAAIFCVSPDYLDQFMTYADDSLCGVSDAVETIVRYFGMNKAPLRIKNTEACDIKGWRMSPRPLKVRG